jgi:hypothetical protein
MRVTSRAAIGCGVNPIALPEDEYSELCAEVLGELVPTVRELQPDVVVTMVTFRDMEDRQWSAVEGLLTPSDQRFRRHLLAGYEWFVTVMHTAGAGTVLFVIPPTPAVPAVGNIAAMLDSERIEGYRRVLRALPLSFTEGIAVADLATWLEDHPDPPARADGLHWTLDAAVEVVRSSRLFDDADVGLGGLPAVGEQLLGFFVLDRAADDDVIALLPVGRCRDLVLGRQLK